MSGSGVKISGLPNASLPLSGDDAGPVVQSGVTKKLTNDVFLAAASAAGANAAQPAAEAAHQYALDAQAAADETAASVTNAAYQRETLLELQGISGVTEGQLGVVYGAGDDRGVYRYLSGAWTYESDTIPQVEGRIGVIEGTIKPEPSEQTRALVVADDEGNTALELTEDELRTAGMRVTRTEALDALFQRFAGSSINIKVTANTVEIGEDAHAAGMPNVLRAWADLDSFAVLAAYTDGTLQLGGLRTAIGENGRVDLLTPSGARFYNSEFGIEGLTFELSDRTDIATAWADDEGFFGSMMLPDGTVIDGSTGTDPVTGSGYSAAEIAERNASNLAESAQVARQVNLTAQRPTAAYNHFPSYGQSLAGGQEGWPALTRVPPYDGVLTHGLSVHPVSSGGARPWTPIGDTDLHPLVGTVRAAAGGGATLLDEAEQAALIPGDGNVGETPLEAAVIALRRAWNNHFGVSDDTTRRFIASTAGRGGTSIAELSGGIDWARLVDCAAAMKEKATSLSGDYCIPAILWLQGEQDYADGTTKAAYKAALTALVEAARTDIQIGIAGQANPFLFVTYQTGASYTVDAGDLAVGMAQLELALENPDWLLACPVYPVVDKGGHLTSNGYRWVGEQFGKVLAKVFVFGQGWKPLHPRRITKRGREILLDMHVPEPPLAWDLPYVQQTAVDYATKGFAARDASGANAIASVEIVSDTGVLVTLARDPVGDTYLRYAGKATFNGNGCLRDSDSTVSFAQYEYAAGSGQYATEEIAALVDKPYPLHNWCVAFDLQILDD